MIQIYKKDNMNFEMNGDAVLHPLYCKAHFVLNGEWILEMSNPLDKNADLIVEDAVICVNTPYGKKQRYRIIDRDKSDSGIICTAYPVFLDARNDCFLNDIRPTNKTGQDALDLMLAPNSKYHASSDIKKASTSYYIDKNFIQALNGDDENSFINRWGGEIVYSNYDIIVNEKVGNDNDLRVEFGFNLTGVSEKIDMSNVVTRIIPKSFNGYKLPDDETVDSQNIDKYATIHTRVIEYHDVKLKEDAQENDKDNGIIVCDTLDELYQELRKKAQNEYDNHIDMPSITYDVSMIDLSRLDEYRDYKELLNVELGDVVHIKHRRLNIQTDARVIEIEYDCINEKIESLVLGDFESNYFNDVSSIVNSVSQVIDIDKNTLMANKIAGVIDLMNTNLRAQKNIAQKQDVRAILFEDLDKNSPTFGAMCLGTKGIQIAGKRNETDTDWNWGTAIDFQTIYANYIIAGILSDVHGNNYWNLDTGELNTKYAKMVEATINNSYINKATIVDAVITGLLKGVTIEGGNINVTSDIYVGKKIIMNKENTNFGIDFGTLAKLIADSYSGDDRIIIELNKSSGFMTSGLRLMKDTSSLDGENVQLMAKKISLSATSTINASVPITTGSDKKLKQNIKDIDIASLIDYTRVKSFDYINAKKDAVGVIAQDYLDTPYEKYILSKNKEGYLTVDYNVFLMACVQKLQQLERKIKNMEERSDDK